MKGNDHYRKAEQLLDAAAGAVSVTDQQLLTARAHAHAVLAQAAGVDSTATTPAAPGSASEVPA